MSATEDQTQEWINDIVRQFRLATDVSSLLNLGVDYLRLQYVPRVVKACYAEFVACMNKLAPDDAGKKVVAVDLPAIFHAQYSIYPESSGSVIQSVADRVAKFYTDTVAEDMMRFIVATDSKELDRKKKFAGFKSGRDVKEEAFKETLEQTITAIKERGYRVLAFDGQESDDILASVSYRAKLRKQNCVLVTDDRDTWQCLGMGTVSYSPRNKDYTDAERLMSLHGITPQQAIDWWSMVGKNDIPGANMIGEKTASELLAKYGTFMGIYDARYDFTEKRRKAIEEFANEHYWIARELHTLNKGLEILW